ncbi:hypothetical protein [Devosia lacusdianchii]|uniref:hypothetical protein n=1 Tax=Devosia lacusdianchii TaxID=2917991 RepID=UPI001F06EAB4|nr:hypothetical protein [Devosia sp. JXJ CY 41]
MNKLTTLTAIAGLVTALTTIASPAAVFNHVAGKPNVPGSAEATDPDCTAVLGYMRTPKGAEIMSLVAAHIAIIPVCEDLTVPGRNNYGPLFVNGNAELLRQPIARNPALIDALRARDYDQNDVVSVRFGGNDSIIFYVHQRDMR